jgi:hypothetical protein
MDCWIIRGDLRFVLHESRYDLTDNMWCYATDNRNPAVLDEKMKDAYFFEDESLILSLLCILLFVVNILSSFSQFSTYEL